MSKVMNLHGTKPFTQQDFKALDHCHEPGCTCTHLELKSPCCFSENIRIAYDQADGTLCMLCSNCLKLIARVQVAEGGDVIFNGSKADA